MGRFKFNSSHIFDSAAAYFGSDNVGLCGIAWFFKVCCTTCLRGLGSCTCAMWHYVL